MRLTRKMTACLTMLALMLTATIAFAVASPPDWGTGVITVKGVAAGKSTTKNPGLRRAQAHRAAVMDAQRNLAESVRGVKVTANSYMKDMEFQSDEVRTGVDAIISNMTEIGEPQYDQYDVCTVTMQMSLFGGNNSVASVAFLPFKDEPKVAFPAPTNKAVVNQPSDANQKYTGLIIECLGKGIDPVMSPVIKKTGGEKIYGHENLDYDKIVMTGMASYADSVSDQISRSRAGSNPLVIKAESLDDLNSTPVVSVENADRILAANQRDKFLENCAVVFVK